MSNHLAIAAVTATFQRVLQEAIQEEVYGARVTTTRPNQLESGSTETGINMYLYLITPNPAFRTPDPMTRRPKGELVKRSQVAMDLQYLLSFYGNEAELEAQRLYGAAVQMIQDGLTLTSDMIRDTLADSTMGFLAGADLADQVEPLRITPTEVSVENLSKLWSVFFQTPYVLSATYRGTVVLLDSDDSGERALPVRDRRTLISPFRQILIDRVVAQEGPIQPILPNSTLMITGRHLFAPIVLVRIAGIEITPESVSDNRIGLSLNAIPRDLLRAGMQGVQVVHPVQPYEVSSAYRGVESNLAAFVLRPRVTDIEVAEVEQHGHGTLAAAVTLHFELTVGAQQLVVLILNEWSAENRTSYLFKSLPRQRDSETVTIAITNVKAGEYLVRVQIDGAESLLTFDNDPQSPTFNWYIAPRLTIEPPDSDPEFEDDSEE
ncbi:MAG: DUF4255 domain-containing protein [Leptolyngbyaceae cyanobacterium bins.59]|nr:DUF4255 domain-containing protein [Leptolyngbyaceae cyanobacterium bins.59]